MPLPFAILAGLAVAFLFGVARGAITRARRAARDQDTTDPTRRT